MTPHIEAKKEDVAATVIMPGDPLRAKFIAETYLDDYKLINNVRGMLGYTGTYKGKRVSVMGSGMGMPSIGIYSYELFKFYDVDTIIRVGSCGAYTNQLDLYDLILVTSSYSESNYAYKQSGNADHILYSDSELNKIIKKTANEKNIKIIEGVIHSSDVFYAEDNNYQELYDKYHCLGVEMESFALFHNAKQLNKQAACLLTVSDSLVTKEMTSSEERQSSFTSMIELALESL
ncbi:MAG: purine-nucleoside phosphorylase [Bacilli bacterium]|nr:purine-nucleoside phosphorylase [Bacilli bacterium]MDD4809128.1 purine-nucleoside phosphorylase [Bacilli bacterium]